MCISDSDKNFPYRFLMRFDLPEHIDRLLRRTLWAWLQEQANPNESEDEVRNSDYLATQVMWLIVICPESPGVVLDVLAKSASEAILVRIAENSNTWASTLKRLVEHPSHLVRMGLADNPNTPDTVIFALAHDEHADVRHALAANHKASQTVLQILSEDENCHVAARAKKTLHRVEAGEMILLPVVELQEKKAVSA